jgi:hypothetical protein
VFGSGCRTCSDVGFSVRRRILVCGVSDFLTALLFAFGCICVRVYCMCSDVGIVYAGVL